MNGRVTNANNLKKNEHKKKDSFDDILELEEFEITNTDINSQNYFNKTNENETKKSSITNTNTNQNTVVNKPIETNFKPTSSVKPTNNNLNNIFSVFNNSSLLNQTQTYKIETNTPSSRTQPIFNFQTESKIKSKTNLNTFSTNNEPTTNTKFRENKLSNNTTNLVDYSFNWPGTTNKINKNRQDEFTSIKIEPSKNVNKSGLYVDYSYREDSNSKYRNTMEDFSKIIENFMDDSNRAFFSLYDGHGGADPVKYAKDRMPDLFSKYLQLNKDIFQVFETTFHKLDDELKFTDSDNSGCTACLVYLTIEENKRFLYCANVGDTRAIIISKDSSQRLTYDDKCTDQAEVDRIKQKGGLVFNGRVLGQLVLTRALGDHALKKYGVVSTPHTKKIEIKLNHTFVVIASDGLWDVLSDEDVALMSLSKTTSSDLSTSLINAALKKGTRDNLSVITIKLN